MKRGLLLPSLLLVIAFSSCKKDYVCECTTTSPSGITSVAENTGKMKKKEAIARCNEGDEAFNNGIIVVTRECEISGGGK